MDTEYDCYGQRVRLTDGAPKLPTCQGALLEQASLFGRYGGNVTKSENLRKADAWIKLYGQRVKAPKAPKLPKAEPAPKPKLPKAEPVKAAPLPLPPPPVEYDSVAIRVALATIRDCKGSAEALDTAADMFNADWPEGWPRSVEIIWDRAFQNA